MCKGSCLKALPEPLNVKGSINIAVDIETAGRTGMDTNRQVFRDSDPTLGAELSRVFGGNFNNQAASLFRFASEYLKEPEPSHISHRPVEGMTAIPGVHLLNTDSAIVFKQLISEFEVEVPPLVGDLLMGFGNKHPRLDSAPRASNSAGQSLLPHSKHILRLLEEAGVVNLHTLGGCQKGLAADINAYNLIRWGKRLSGNIITGEAGIPLTSRGPADSDCFNISLNRAGQPEFEPAHISDRQVFIIQFPACLFQGKAVVAVSAFESRKASLAVTKAIKESIVGSVKAFNHILKNLRAYITVFGKRRFEFRQLLNLLIAGYGAVMGAVSMNTLLKGSVVELATKIKPTLGFLNSLRVGLNTVLKRLLPLHNLSIANLRRGGKPYRASPSVSPALKCGVLDGVFL